MLMTYSKVASLTEKLLWQDVKRDSTIEPREFLWSNIYKDIEWRMKASRWHIMDTLKCTTTAGE